MEDVPRGDPFELRVMPLWMRAQDGDEAAYRDALSAIAVRLRSYFSRRMSATSPDEIEDLTQETLLAIHLHRGTHVPDIPISAWVHAIARHKLIDFFRRRGRREAWTDSFDALDESLHPAVGPEPEARRDLFALLGSLPHLQQQAILLMKVEGLTAPEASRRTGISATALKVQVHRGIKRLARIVKDGS